MENSSRSVASGEESLSVYLSFDGDSDDTLASKWQSAMASQTSHYLEMQNMEQDLKHDETLEEKKNDMKSILDTLMKNDISKDQGSPLRPFDKSILNKHNALSSTPTKNMTMPGMRPNLTTVDAEKENTQPDEQNSTLSSTIDGTVSTVKTNTMFSETNMTLDENSVKENNNKSSVYPLSANVVLENITEVSAEETSITVLSASPIVAADRPASNEKPSTTVPPASSVEGPSSSASALTAVDRPASIEKPSITVSTAVNRLKSNVEPFIAMPSTAPLVAFEQEIKANEVSVVNDMVNEVSELIVKALKLTECSSKPDKSTKLPAVTMPRPRRSFLPTASGTTFKQRMSIVVKTTLNSPARKLATGNPISRRSCLPTTKSAPIVNSAYRQSLLLRSCTENSSSNAIILRAKKPAVGVDTAKAPTTLQFKCRLCTASFSEKKSLDMHMDTHTKSALAMRNKNSYFCKYCDKKFVLERALHIHLMENCDKIPPGEKRKLSFTELNHVQKAKLPKLTSNSSAGSCDSSSKPRASIMQQLEKQPVMAPKSGGAADPAAKDQMQMVPPSVKKAPKSVAHAGVYRTPTKSVPCHICKQSFKSILDYTNHCLTVHSKNKKPATANALSALNVD
ncbi:PREDICTED: cell wall protein RBR3 [Drosophila arizonae]|uniref:Cell wall protein RBR3 n=1 Tax=Drosophila arizonae TaxID=7263 RepID=A0ABM1PRS3_DROAR|nr:PREDICTED: cell wall protein RBR3 [Drosophila arizonae]